MQTQAIVILIACLSYLVYSSIRVEIRLFDKLESIDAIIWRIAKDTTALSPSVTVDHDIVIPWSLAEGCLPHSARNDKTIDLRKWLACVVDFPQTTDEPIVVL